MQTLYMYNTQAYTNMHTYTQHIMHTHTIHAQLMRTQSLFQGFSHGGEKIDKAKI